MTINNNFNVTFSSLNCRGLRVDKQRFAKLRKLKKFSKIIFLSETHSCIDDERKWNLQNPGWHILYAHGERDARGTAMMFKKSDVQLDPKYNPAIDSEGRYVIANLITNHTPITTASLYLPNLSAARKDIEKYIKVCQKVEEQITLLNNTGQPMFIGGDFNLIFDPIYDAYGGNPTIYSEAKNWWMQFVNTNDMVDTYRELHPDTLQVTYRRPGSGIGRRLDYLLIPRTFIKYVNHFQHYDVDRCDHLMLRADIAIVNRKIPFMWKFNESLEHDITFMHYCKNEWIPAAIQKARNAFPEDKILQWELFKVIIRIKIKQYCSNKTKGEIKERAETEQALEVLAEIAQANPSADNLTKLQLKRDELSQIEIREAEKMAYNARIDNYEYGEKSTKFFYNKMKSNFENSNITELVIDGLATSNPDEINEALYQFYKALYEKESEVDKLNDSNKQDDISFINKFTEHYPKINSEARKMLESPITLAECKYVVFKKMKRGKAPGCDGLGRHFYYLFWDEIGQMVHQALLAGAERGFLSDTQKLSTVRLIPKSGKDKRVMSNLRPISLMCCDAKIYSKVLTLRMEPIMHQLISSHQNAYVPGRYIGNGIKTLQFIKEHAQNNNRDLLFMNLDVKKAFDSTNYKYMYHVLEKVGFGPKFVGYIKTMYTDCKAAVLNMGKTSKMYNLERSCRQGDPISGFTFILIMQGFINRIIHEKSISGYVLNNYKSYKITNFADDATLILDKPDDIKKVIQISNDFGRISGLKTHPQKTEVFVVNGTIEIDKNLGLLLVDTMKVLGIQFARNKDREQEINYKPVIDKFNKAIKSFKARNMQIVGKALATKSLLISRAQYVFSMLHPNSDHLKVLNTLMYNQFWGGSDKIKRDVLAKDYSSGGLKLHNLHVIAKAAQASWMGRLSNDQCCPRMGRVCTPLHQANWRDICLEWENQPKNTRDDTVKNHKRYNRQLDMVQSIT